MNRASKFRRALAAAAIAVLVIGSFGVRNIGDNTRVARAYQDLHDLPRFFEKHKSVTGKLPTTEEGFHALIQRPEGTSGRWLKTMDKVPIDPWGNRYRYRKSTRDGVEIPEILSAGKDGLIGTEDDLSSLDPTH
jgi:general secretion pathway protein G